MCYVVILLNIKVQFVRHMYVQVQFLSICPRKWQYFIVLLICARSYFGLRRIELGAAFFFLIKPLSRNLLFCFFVLQKQTNILL